MIDLPFIVEKCVVESAVPSKPKWLEDLGGFYGYRFQEFLYRLGHYGLKYLEVGIYQGASLLSYAASNSSECWGIDKFKFLMASETLVRHEAHLHNVKINLIRGNCWDWDIKRGAPRGVSVYYYDGPHDQTSQKAGILQYRHTWSSPVLLIVDDFNWELPQLGTLDAIDELEKEGWEQVWCKPIFETARPQDLNDGTGRILVTSVDRPELPNRKVIETIDRGNKQGWWNGVGLFVLQKTNPMQAVETKKEIEVEKDGSNSSPSDARE